MDDFLPKIKCSNCQAEVELSAMGEHVCRTVQKPATPEPQIRNSPFNTPPSSGLRQLDGPLTKIGRMAPPPPIDPHAANRPFLRVRVPSSPSTGGIQSATPQRSARSPIFHPQRSQTTPLPRAPSPELVGFDCAFPPFPRPESRDGVKSRSRSKTIVKADRAPSPLVESPVEVFTRKPLPRTSPPIPEDKEGEEQEEERRRRSRAHRQVSIDSKSLSRMSLASSRYGESLSRTSTPGLPNTAGSRAFGNFLEEIPPLPPCPIKSHTPSPFTAAPEPYRFSDEQSFEKDRTVSPPRSATGLPGFELGFPIDGENTVQSPPPEPERDPEPELKDHHSHSARFSTASSDDEPVVDNFSTSPERSTENLTLPMYSVDEDFSVSNFARGLGLTDPYHATNDSTSSSDTSPSNATTHSSFSTQPSEPSSADLKPPTNPYKYDLDSPTDPLFQQGRLKPAVPTYERYINSEHDLKTETKAASQPVAVPRHSRSDSTLTKVKPESASPESKSSPVLQAPPKSPGPTRRVRCRGCSEIIIGKSVSSADGRLTGRWHKACFVCTTCRSPFQTADFYVLNNQPYCDQHYHELNGSLCSSCGKGIEGPCLQTEEVTRDSTGKERNQIFHPDCFRCKTCRIVLKGDYLVWNGEVYCERDARRAASIAYPPPPPSPGPFPGPSFGNQPPPGYGPRPGYHGPPPRSVPRQGGPGQGMGPGPGSGLGPGRGRGRGYPRPGGRGGPPPPGPPGLYPPNRGGYARGPSPDKLAPPPQSQPPPLGEGGPASGPRRFPERRTTKLMMI